MQLIRWPIGQLILLVDAATAPRRPQRDAASQARIDDAARNLALYQYRACPFCVKTRRALRRLGIEVELRDAKNDPRWRDELLAEGGRQQVPCLRIPQPDGSVRWMYESDDIIAYLERIVSDHAVAEAA
ncbi:MAG: glutaredoxin [Gammaproteobacteria bacterium]|nr:glutaredoxin [Gammaproteobacteria bacterium]